MPHPAVLGFSRRLGPDLLAIAEPAADTHTNELTHPGRCTVALQSEVPRRSINNESVKTAAILLSGVI